jgi:Fe-S-cluster containining protein
MPKALPILDGRRFGCTGCGACCKRPGFVFMSPEELTAIAAHLELATAAFRRRFGAYWDEAEQAWGIEAVDGRGCPLLDAEDRCTVHAVKPAQCRTFPFWPELLDDARAWEAAKSYCEGLDAPDGQLYSAEEIRRLREGHGSAG